MTERPDDRLRRNDDAGWTSYDDMIRAGQWVQRVALVALVFVLVLGLVMMVSP